MPDTQQSTNTTDEQIPVLIRLDPKIHDFFLQKAQKAGVGIETYLCSTLTIVLGCRAFNALSVCSPQITEEACLADMAK